MKRHEIQFIVLILLMISVGTIPAVIGYSKHKKYLNKEKKRLIESGQEIEKKIPDLKKGMPYEEVVDLLGNPDKSWNEEEHVVMLYIITENIEWGKGEYIRSGTFVEIKIIDLKMSEINTRKDEITECDFFCHRNYFDYFRMGFK